MPKFRTLALFCASTFIWALAAGPSATQQTGPATQSPRSLPSPAPPALVLPTPIPIGLGETREAVLGPTSSPTESGNFHVAYLVRLNRNQDVVATVRALDRNFLPFVAFGRIRDGRWRQEPGGGARGSGSPSEPDSIMRPAIVRFVATEPGEYVVRAVALDRGAGRFSLALAERTAPPPPPPTPLAMGQRLEGELTDTSAILTDEGDRPYGRYVLTVPAPMRVHFTVKSTDFDPMLRLGRAGADGAYIAIDSDVDGGDGLSAALSYALPAAGQYFVDAISENSAGRGRFEIAATDLGVPGPVPRPVGLERGRVVKSKLELSDASIIGVGRNGAVTDLFRPYKLFAFEGRRGEAVTVTVQSAAFDTNLELGALTPVGFATVAENDDFDKADGPPCPTCERTDSRIRTVFERNGTFVVRVSTLYSAKQGEFTIRVE